MSDSGSNEIRSTLEAIQSLVRKQRYNEAATLCERACGEPDVDARVWHILGAIHGQNNNLSQAEFCTRQALAINPLLGAAHLNLAVILQRQHKLDEAEQSLQRAIKNRPSDSLLYNELGNTYSLAGKHRKAVAAYRKAISIAPAFCDAYFNLGNTFIEMKDLHSALRCMRTAFSCNNGFTKAKVAEANILEMQGDIESACKCLEPWLDKKIVDPGLADAFAAVSKHIGAEQKAVDILTEVIHQGGVHKQELSGLYFRLGSLHERLQHFDEAFLDYTRGNICADVPNNSKSFIHSLREARQVFTKEVMALKLESIAQGEGLVYIVGMPRSGTSLVEQVLAAHTQVAAGGELAFLSLLYRDVFAVLTAHGTETDNLDVKALEYYASRHLDVMRANLGSAQRITDKTPHNFRYVGLINLLFPKARIIHCRRDPLDTCVSCFSNRFIGKELAYSNDLETLAEVYREYESLMQYWRDELLIPVLDVPYEAVVDDIQFWSRRVVEYCGLEWEAQCMEFYKTDRQVYTASYNQVRQPVYKSSVNRWKHFDKHLGPLKRMLGERAGG